MLIFGYGPRKPKDLGPTAPARCPSCGNEVEYHLLQQRRWVSLFFVPVIPTGTDHALVCPLCRHTVALDAHQGRLALGLASATADHREGRLDDDAYRAQVDAFWQAVGGRRDTGETAGPAGRHPWDTEAGPWTTGGASGGTGSTGSTGPMGGATGPVFGVAGTGPGEPRQPTHPSASARPTDTGGAPPPDPANRRPDPDPGWYPDPFGEADERYWDGGRWTQGTKPPRP